MNNIPYIFLIIVLGYFVINFNVEGIGYDEKIILVIGKNGGDPDVEIAKRILTGLNDSGFHDIHIRIDESISKTELNTSHVIVIGGPEINQITREFLSELKLQFYEIPLPLTKDPQLQRKWNIVNTETHKNYGDYNSENFGLGFIHTLKKKSNDMNNETTQYLFFISGIEAKGTIAASNYFFGQKCYDSVGDVEFILVNMDIGKDEKGCAEKIHFEYLASVEKIFDTSQISLEKNNLKITKIIKNNGVEKSTFFPGDKFEIEIKLENKGKDPINYSFYEPLLSFLILNDASSQCQQNEFKLHCIGLINQDETTIINYKGIISDKAKLGNWFSPKIAAEYYLKNNSTRYVAQSNDSIIRIQDTINADARIVLDKDSIKMGDMFDVKTILENKGIQQFYANGTLLLDEALEFVSDENNSSINFEFGPIKPEEVKEMIFKLRVKDVPELLMSEKQTIEFIPSIYNQVYDADANSEFVHLEPTLNVTKNIFVGSLVYLFLKPLIENWPFLLVITSSIILLVQFKRKSFPFKPYKATVSEF